MKNKTSRGRARASDSRTTSSGLPQLSFATIRAWSAWLASNHASSRGVWLKIAKKDAGVTSMSYADALEGALIWGWIDGQKAKLDAAWWLQKFTPRGAKSLWSKRNRDQAEALYGK